LKTRVFKFKALLTDKQKQLFSETEKEQQLFFNYSLNCLYHQYGIKKINRFFPKGMQKNYLISKLRKEAQQKGILNKSHSQISDATLKNLLVNFEQYRKYLWGLYINKDDDWKDKNPNWYKRKRVNFIKEKKMALRIPNNNQTKILSKREIKVQHFGVIKLTGSLKGLDKYKISLVTIKPFKNGTYQLQITLFYNSEKDKTLTGKSVKGYDWGIKDNNVMIADDGQIITLNSQVDNALLSIQNKINLFNKKISKTNPKSNLYQKLQKLKNKWLVKRVNVSNQELWRIANLISNQSDVIAVEDLKSKTMRNKSNKFNYKLSLRQPSKLIHYLECVVNRNNKLLIKVNPYKTSQYDFETGEVSKKDLSIREYVNSKGYLVDRDVNAAKNIKNWALNPLEHIGYKTKQLNKNEIITVI
jgi:Transposase and inactivated derivatives